MNISEKQYAEMLDATVPKSNIYKNSIMAFIIGGTVCTLGQFFTQLYLMFGIELLDARTFTCVTLILISAILTAVHLYDDIAKIAGAGTLVPITGFANAVVSPAIEFKSEGQILGVSAKIFAISGPVIVFGVLSSVLYGIVYYLCNYLMGGM